jgi:peptide/nickel transport system substrate-binding protein
MYNQSSYTTYVGVLADSWTSSTDLFNITFHLRSGVHFSNGHAFNAYVMWFSLYRALVMGLDPSFILTQNFGFPHTNASSDPADVEAAAADMTTYLNTFDFLNPTSAQIAIMADPDQSFQVVDAQTIQLNLGHGYLGEVPYVYVFATLAAPIAAAIDPAIIAQHGGVSNATNDWMTTNMIGTGPYLLGSYNPSTGFTLQPDPNYWGVAAAAGEPWNNAIQPAKASIQIDFQGDTAITTQDLKSGRIVGASFAYLGPSTVNDLKTAQCVVVTPLDPVYGSTAGAWWVFMNQNHEPFNNLSVRAAVVHAIDYDRIIQVAFGGNAIRWTGPVPPGYPYYNPESVAPYSYDVPLARQYMNNSPWPLTGVNPVQGGYPTVLKYEYINLGDWPGVAQLLRDDLAQIGIRIDPVPITLDNLYEEQARDQNGVCTTESTANGGPFYIGQEFYTSDYISPDDWTQNNAISYGSANDCMAQYYNATMDDLVLTAAGIDVPAQQSQMYADMTRMMYDNYTNAWLVSPTQFQVYSPFLKGVIPNPMGSGLPFTMMFNTEYAE